MIKHSLTPIGFDQNFEALLRVKGYCQINLPLLAFLFLSCSLSAYATDRNLDSTQEEGRPLSPLSSAVSEAVLLDADHGQKVTQINLLQEENKLQLDALSENIEEISLLTIPSERQTSDFVKEQNLDLSPSQYQKSSKKEKTCLGLSIDGGGIRGLMPAIWLSELENELRGQGLKAPLSNVFDYVGGTSIGGILSLGVAANIPPDQLIDIFNDKAQREKVFSTSGRKLVRFIDWFGLVSHQYNAVPLENLLKEQFGEDKTLQNIHTNVLVTACTTEGYPWIFKKGEEGKKDYKLWQVARCTSAAPTYFSAYQPYINNQAPAQPFLIDGGLWVNNPSTLVAASIIKEYQGGRFNPKNLYMLSLGTGETSAKALSVSAGKSEAGKIINSLMSSHSRGNHMMMSQLLDENYYRVNPFMDKFIELDDVTQLSIATLAEYARKSENAKIVNKFVTNLYDVIRKRLEE